MFSSLSVVSDLGKILVHAHETIQAINQKCQNLGLPLAFGQSGFGDGLIQGNPDYRFEGFGLACPDLIPPKPCLTFWVHYKPGTPQQVNLGRFEVPINLAQMALVGSLREMNFLRLDQINVPTQNPAWAEPNHDFPVTASVAPVLLPREAPLGNTGVHWSDLVHRAPSHGASPKTARQDGLSQGGLDASAKLAETDLERVRQLWTTFVQVAQNVDLPPEVLAAIASRESRCGQVLDERGCGDNGHAFGIMQVDKRYHQILGGESPSSLAHIEQGAGILKSYLKQVQQKHPDWEPEYILKGAIAAYNFGPGNVQTKENIDLGTTHDDYSADVLARARFYAQKLGQLLPPLVATTPPSASTAAPGRPYLAESCHITALADCDVRWVQEQLKRGGYYTGKLDGQVGPQTRDALRKFKQDYCLEYPQLIGATTIDALAELQEMKSDPNDLQLSENFKLSEMLRSQTAERQGIKNYPTSPEHIENLKALCQKILEPVRTHFGVSISPSSGYRCPELNAAVGGAKNSQHVVGEAVDFVVPKASIPDVCRWIRDHLEFDQLIMEKYNPRTGSGWIHCSYKRQGRNRNQFFSIP